MKLIFSLLILGNICFASNFKSLKTNNDNSYDIISNEKVFKISFVDDNIAKIVVKSSISEQPKDYATTNTSYIKCSIFETPELINISTNSTTIKINKTPINISFYNKKNNLILKEADGFFENKDTIGFKFYLKDNEEIYGTGSRSIPLNRRGYAFRCYNQPNYGYGMNADFLNYSIPQVVSSSNYILLFDNPAKAYFDIGKKKPNILEYGSVKGGNMVYYFINSNNTKNSIKDYCKLTGFQPLPPIWAFGNLQSRFGYTSQNETDSIVRKIVNSGYPIDAIIIDLYWFGKELQDGYMGNLSWDTTKWTIPKKMINEFKKLGIKTITVSEPFFTKKSKHFETLDKEKLLCLDSMGNTATIPNFYFGNAGLIDIFKPEAKLWFCKQYKLQKDIGVTAWWGDLGEPEMHPEFMNHCIGKSIDIHGLYGDEWVKMLYQWYSKDYPTERLFMLGRAGYAGSQKYGLIPWSGDVGRTWSGLKAQIPIMLGMGLSGLPYMHSDAGGFAGGKRDSILYTRWLQFAVFTPVFRPHSDPNAPPEPVFYDSTTQRIVKNYIKLRYRMLPYNYTLGFEASQTGIPLARPLFINKNEIKTDSNSNRTYYWGENFFVAPVFEPNILSMNIKIPDGYWFDFWTNKIIKGNSIVNQSITMENIPVFVKAGSIIPFTHQSLQNTDEYNTNELDINYYFHNSVNLSEYKMYCDDGKTKDAYKLGKYEIIELNTNNNNEYISLSICKTGGTYENKPLKRNFNVRIFNLDKNPIKITHNKNQISWVYNEKILNLKVEFTDKTEIKIFR